MTQWIRDPITDNKSHCFLFVFSKVPAPEHAEKGGISNVTEAKIVLFLTSLFIKVSFALLLKGIFCFGGRPLIFLHCVSCGDCMCWGIILRINGRLASCQCSGEPESAFHSLSLPAWVWDAKKPQKRDGGERICLCSFFHPEIQSRSSECSPHSLKKKEKWGFQGYLSLCQVKTKLGSLQ